MVREGTDFLKLGIRIFKIDSFGFLWLDAIYATNPVLGLIQKVNGITLIVESNHIDRQIESH